MTKKQQIIDTYHVIISDTILNFGDHRNITYLEFDHLDECYSYINNFLQNDVNIKSCHMIELKLISKIISKNNKESSKSSLILERILVTNDGFEPMDLLLACDNHYTKLNFSTK